MMAERLNVPSTVLKSTLMNTVFKGAKDDEFVALVIVANEYQLNPLTKEIYAFPAKGGGIVPVISVDGWNTIMNRHPMFDGIEFNDIPDADGNLLAIESVIYRKDRTRPIKVIEYLDECKRSTEPWKMMPARMLRHKALIQGARLAFGFSGIYDQDDAEVGDIGPGLSPGPMPMRDITPQRAPEPRQTSRPAIAHDPDTGEIVESEGETAARLDREGYAAMEGRDQSQMGEAQTTVDAAEAMIAEIVALTEVAEVNAYVRDADFSLLDDDQASAVREAAAEHSELIMRAKAAATKEGR
ncbi:recombinase RecT [Rhizorhabdus wittichii]|uniref:Recombinase RecT n=2 Tax=Rhizorhabdus wittichii TaxID=160791 RepID=A0A975HGM2_9SPHN|nr:recombinase RecT [Rhizorhabdus wittichii]